MGLNLNWFKSYDKKCKWSSNKSTGKETGKTHLCALNFWAALDCICNLDIEYFFEKNNITGVRCDVCGRMLSCNRSLSDHKRQVHDKANHIKCELCRFTTFQPYMLKRHKQRNHDKTTKYDCEQCDFSTYDKGRLRVHKRGVHEKIKPHKCTECTSSYQTKYRLAVHMLREHNIVYKYK